MQKCESHGVQHTALATQLAELQIQHDAKCKESEARRVEQANTAQSLNAAHSHNSALSSQLAGAQQQHAQAVQSLNALTSQHEVVQHQHNQLVAEHATSSAEIRLAENKLGLLNAEHAVLQVCCESMLYCSDAASTSCLFKTHHACTCSE